MQDWLKEGKIKKKNPLTGVERKGIKEIEKAFGGVVKFVQEDKDGNGEVEIITLVKIFRLRGSYGPILKRKMGNLPYFYK